MASGKVLFLAALIGPDGSEYTARIMAHDRRQARRMAESGAKLSGSSVVSVDTDAGAFIGARI